MAIKSYNPTTPSRRHMTVVDKSALSKNGPEKSLTRGKKSSGGLFFSDGEIRARWLLNTGTALVV